MGDRLTGGSDLLSSLVSNGKNAKTGLQGWLYTVGQVGVYKVSDIRMWSQKK